MKSIFNKKFVTAIGTLGAILTIAEQSFAVTEYRQRVLSFITSSAQIRDSISLPVADDVETLLVPVKKITARVNRAGEDERVEPVQISVLTDDQSLSDLSKELAYAGKEAAVKDMFLQKIKKLNSNLPKVRVGIENSDFEIINIKLLARHLGKTHHNLKIKPDIFFKDKNVRKEFFNQLKGFLPRDQRKAIYEKIKARQDIEVAQDLLPEFARKMVKKFTIFRGPNCFHASLAFHGKVLTDSPFINVKEEKGYHRAMINYDELWRAINKHFYEVNPKDTPLKYGDMIVFFNIPKDPPAWVDFRWIRHAATYLVDGYTFSKGSKSPDTPYTIKTLDEEWKTWLGFTKNLGVKVFRRNAKSLKNSPPFDLTDWIY